MKKIIVFHLSTLFLFHFLLNSYFFLYPKMGDDVYNHGRLANIVYNNVYVYGAVPGSTWALPYPPIFHYSLIPFINIIGYQNFIKNMKSLIIYSKFLAVIGFFSMVLACYIFAFGVFRDLKPAFFCSLFFIILPIGKTIFLGGQIPYGISQGFLYIFLAIFFVYRDASTLQFKASNLKEPLGLYLKKLNKLNSIRGGILKHNSIKNVNDLCYALNKAFNDREKLELLSQKLNFTKKGTHISLFSLSKIKMKLYSILCKNLEIEDEYHKTPRINTGTIIVSFCVMSLSLLTHFSGLINSVLYMGLIYLYLSFLVLFKPGINLKNYWIFFSIYLSSIAFSYLVYFRHDVFSLMFAQFLSGVPRTKEAMSIQNILEFYLKHFHIFLIPFTYGLYLCFKNHKNLFYFNLFFITLTIIGHLVGIPRFHLLFSIVCIPTIFIPFQKILNINNQKFTLPFIVLIGIFCWVLILRINYQIPFTEAILAPFIK